MCCEDKLLWPCLVEVGLRESGVPPVTISDYPDYAEA